MRSLFFKKYLPLLLIPAFPIAAYAQCGLSYQQTSSNLLKAGSFSGWVIQNSRYWEDKVYFTEDITTTSGEPVLKEESTHFIIGIGSIPAPATCTAIPQFSNAIAKAWYDQSGRLPYDNYLVCIELKLQGTGQVLARLCQNVNLLLSPPQLISPFNQEHIPPVQPVFTWLAPQNPLAETRDFDYTLTIVEVQPGQGGTEAINTNPPLLSLSNLKSTSYLYQASSPDLVPGHLYAWQVSANAFTQLVGKTEVWTFTPDSTAKKAKPGPVLSQSFTELKRRLDGGVVEVVNGVRFKISSGEKALPERLTFYDETHNNITPAQLQFKATFTANRYEIDLFPYKNFKDKHTYYLEFQSVRGEVWKMAFRYSRNKKLKSI